MGKLNKVLYLEHLVEEIGLGRHHHLLRGFLYHSHPAEWRSLFEPWAVAARVRTLRVWTAAVRIREISTLLRVQRWWQQRARRVGSRLVLHLAEGGW